MKYSITFSALALAMGVTGASQAQTQAQTQVSTAADTSASETKTVTLHQVNNKGKGREIGKVTLRDTAYGLVLTPRLNGLNRGLHGFHIHENPDCGPKKKDGKITPAGAAGGHLDPKKTGSHGAPWGDGHLGDLPALFVDQDGKATHPVLAPRLKLADVADRALMVHEGGDNYADEPEPLGGGAGRMACGVIK